MWQLVPWVSRRREQTAEHVLRQAASRQRAEHAAAIQRILTQAHIR